MHHSWWGEGVKERMPRVRFGQVHVVNNLFNSSTGSYCVRAAMKANIRVEKNVFIGVQDPLNYNNRTKEDANVNMIGNYYEKIKLTKNGDTLGQGTAFTPPYSMSITDVSTQAKAYALRDSIMAYAGPTLPAPGSSEVTPISSSSITKSSSSAKSSSSVAAAATLTKHGIGSTNQSVKQGESIQEFYFTIENATSATVSGLPEGLSGKLNGSDFTISGTVSSNAEAKAYKFTVTTTGATQNASKSGTITVLQKEIVSSSSKAEISSSSEKVESSSSEKVSSSSEEISSSSEEISSSSSKTTALLKSKDSRQLKLNSLNLKSGISLELNLSQAGIVKISIMNAVGSVIYSENLSAHTGVNAFNLMPKNLTAGTYYMNIRGLGMNESKRVYLR